MHMKKLKPKYLHQESIKNDSRLQLKCKYDLPHVDVIMSNICKLVKKVGPNL